MRTGENLYVVADENGFHYIYPPLLAILLTPFADPPRRASMRPGRFRSPSPCF